MPNLLGTGPSQVPTNADLGKLAFMDVVDTVTNNPYVDTAISDTKPSLLLDFANSKTLDPRITFTRASTGTFYDGKTTAKAEENLILQSQTFENASWVKTSASVTANTEVAPDGTTTAETLTASAATALPSVSQTTTAGAARTFSVFVKAGTHNYIQILYSADTSSFCNFDLSAGTVGSSGGTATGSIVSLGNGWYRCIVVNTATTPVFHYVALVPSSSSTRATSGTYTGTETVYLWGAQLEQRSAVSAYTPTTSSAITNYIPALQTAAAGVPRFDHDPVTGESKGFLIEEQRSNLLTYSSAFDNAAWTKGNATISADTVVAPDGTLTGDKLVKDSGSTLYGRVRFLNAIPSAGTYTLSVYAKAAQNTFLMLTRDGTDSAWYNLSAGIVETTGANTTASIQHVGNGWYRCIYTNTAWTLAGTATIGVSNATNTTTYTGNGFDGIYIWGAQLEAGSFATSYIPTTSAQVTRSADSASITGANFSSWYNQAEGTLYADVAPTSSLGNRVSLDFNAGGASSSYIALLAQRSTNLGILAYVNANGIAQVDASSQTNADGKTVFAYRTNDFAMTRNGSVAFDDTNGSVPQGIDRVFIGDDYNAGNAINGTIKRIAYYPKRLSDAELQEMTL